MAAHDVSALTATRALVDCRREPCDDRAVSIVGSGVGRAVYPRSVAGRRDAEQARAAIVAALVGGFNVHLAAVGRSCPEHLVLEAVERLVGVEEWENEVIVRVCGEELPGREPVAAGLCRARRITEGLRLALERLSGEAVALELFGDEEPATQVEEA